MVKKFLAGMISVLCLNLAQAGKITGGNFNNYIAYSDTADKKDSLLDHDISIADPKQQFKDLINSSSDGSFAGIAMNPLAVSFVEDYTARFSSKMEDMKDWGKPYLDLMGDILEQYDLPAELKYLAVIESYLKAGARSKAGAAGPWQFMPSTARTMGLKIGKKYDERLDFTKSTHAASKYLSNLFALYGDWLLVIAAYNGGPGKVDAAIRKSGSRDFWVLQRYLPQESKNHVKKFIATHYMMEGQGGITTSTKAEARLYAATIATNSELPAASKRQNITGRYNSFIITKHLSMDIATFNKLNPGFDKQIALNGSYDLTLPNEKMDLFLAKKADILGESMQLLLQASN